MPEPTETWDLIVVGAGPAGSTAAREAMAPGRRVLLIDKARFPRTKLCGGGLIGLSLAALPDSMPTVWNDNVRYVGFTSQLTGRRTENIRATSIGMVMRDELDQGLVDQAVAAGVQFEDGVQLTSIEQADEHVEIRTTDGRTFRTRYAIGADGSTSRIARHVGVTIQGEDIGFEVELPTPPGGEWDSTLLIDWSSAGAYAWVFPKGETLTVGVIQSTKISTHPREYLRSWIDSLGLDWDARANPAHGHKTRWKTADSPVRRDRVLVAGDAGGFLEPLTREGISWALRSGTLAGAAVAKAISTGDPGQLSEYDENIQRTLEPERRAGAALLAFFERHPRLVANASRTRAGHRFFARFCRGETTFGALFERRPLRLALALVGVRP